MLILCAETALLPDGWARDVQVEVSEGRIDAVTKGVAGRAQIGCLLPAPVNLHSHAFQRAMAGMTERRGPTPDSFWTWRALMYRFLDHLKPDDVQAIAAFQQMEMLEAGYGCVAEFHYLHHRPGGAPYADLARLWQGAASHAKGADMVVGVAPHSLRAVSVRGLSAAIALAPKAPLHLHIAEQEAEVAEVVAHRGARPVEWLLGNAEVDARWCAVHATQMQPAEALALAATGAVAGLCPITEANLGDGIFDGVRWLGAGGRFGVGSDSNVRISLTEELRMLEYSQRLAGKSRAMFATADKSTGRVLFEGALQGGAQAAGRQSGGIRVGDWADLLALDMAAVDLEGRQGDDILDALIFAGDDRMVRDVWSAGRHLVTEGRHVARDAIEAGYRRVMTSLRARL